MSSLTRGAVKDVRTLVKDVRDRGFELRHDGAQLLIFAPASTEPCGAIPLKVHDHRALKNVRAELRRAGILARPQKRRPAPARPKRPPVPAATICSTPPAPHDDFDWLRRPYDRERSRILRERLQLFLDQNGGAHAQNRKRFAAASVALARQRGLRSFSSNEPEIAAQAALRFLLYREGALSIWAVKLFHETLDEAELRLRRLRQRAA